MIDYADIVQATVFQGEMLAKADSAAELLEAIGIDAEAGTRTAAERALRTRAHSRLGHDPSPSELERVERELAGDADFAENDGILRYAWLDGLVIATVATRRKAGLPLPRADTTVSDPEGGRADSSLVDEPAITRALDLGAELLRESTDPSHGVLEKVDVASEDARVAAGQRMAAMHAHWTGAPRESVPEELDLDAMTQDERHIWEAAGAAWLDGFFVGAVTVRDLSA